jgi:hypothetical protein
MAIIWNACPLHAGLAFRLPKQGVFKELELL